MRRFSRTLRDVFVWEEAENAGRHEYGAKAEWKLGRRLSARILHTKDNAHLRLGHPIRLRAARAGGLGRFHADHHRRFKCEF
jgi:hypothetical protein